jgi:hypothetical protein
MTKYWKVEDQKIIDAIETYFTEHKNAIKSVARFSRKVGGHRTKFGTKSSTFSGRTYISIFFKETPDRTLWKSADKIPNQFWVPKVKDKVLKATFEKVQSEFPSFGFLAAAIKFKEWVGNRVRSPGLQNHHGHWYILTADDYKGVKGLKRLSDIEFEEVSK